MAAPIPRWINVVGLIALSAVVTFLALSPNRHLRWPWPQSPAKSAAEARAPAKQAPRAALPAVPHRETDIAKAFPGIDTARSKEPLPLVLTGTILGRNQREGIAFIGTDEHNPQTYTAGATLANGAEITQIARDYVVLEKDGESVRLYAQNVKSRGRASSKLLLVGGERKSAPAPATYAETFTEFVRPNPVFDGSTLKGYEVYAGKSAGVFSRLGLQAADVITAFDDVPITDSAVAMDMFQQLAGGATMTATVTRKGKTERVPLDGTVVTAELDRVRTAAILPR
jgi:type II secretion system protein C